MKRLSWLLILMLVACGPAAVVTPTVTPSPSSTPMTPTATITPIPATPTDIPILPAEDARKRWLDLLATNGGCQLPCLWGIKPGKSSFQNAKTILMPLIGIAENAYFEPLHGILGGTIAPQYIEGEVRLNSVVDYLYEEDGVVSRVSFRVLEEKLSQDEYGNQITTPIYGSPEFIQRVVYYSLSNLLSEQGIPTSVMISRDLTYENNRRSFLINIVVIYPNQGIWAKYTTWLAENEVGSSMKSCPINARIEMNLFPPGNSDSFYALLDKTDWGITKVGYKPLDEATSMSVEEFYETFRNPTDQCIETPADIWPTPEW